MKCIFSLLSLMIYPTSESQYIFDFTALFVVCFRVHQHFKAKLGLLGEEEDDGYLIAFLLKASHWQSYIIHVSLLNGFNLTVCLLAVTYYYSQSNLCLFHQMMEDTQSDFTMTFRQLSEVSAQQLHNRKFPQVEKRWGSSLSCFCFYILSWHLSYLNPALVVLVIVILLIGCLVDQI